MTRVLLVDDEPLGLRRLELALSEMADVEVVGAASDGEDAVRKIRSLHPDVVFLDVEMPRLCGLRVAEALADNPRPEVVFVTAFPGYAVDAFRVDAADYLLEEQTATIAVTHRLLPVVVVMAGADIVDPFKD